MCFPKLATEGIGVFKSGSSLERWFFYVPLCWNKLFQTSKESDLCLCFLHVNHHSQWYFEGCKERFFLSLLLLSNLAEMFFFNQLSSSPCVLFDAHNVFFPVVYTSVSVVSGERSRLA